MKRLIDIKNPNANQDFIFSDFIHSKYSVFLNFSIINRIPIRIEE
jgi:hypothetical protein